MGSTRSQNATKRTRKTVMPTVEEIVAEAREAKRVKLASMVSIIDLSAALGKHRGNVMKACRKLGVEYSMIDTNGAAYLTREDAAKVAERLA